MNKFQTFEQFLTTSSVHISISEFSLNLLYTAILAYLLGYFYNRCGESLSNRKAFAKNFVLIAMTTMLIITIVKTSLALSLGLVGALSIVRFRTAIKEPEELSYIFLCIAIGLGFGANQGLITVCAFCIIICIILLRSRFFSQKDFQNLHITISSNEPKKLELTKIISVFEKNTIISDLKRFDENDKTLEACFLVEFDNVEKLNALKTEILSLSKFVRISFLDRSGVF